MEENRKVQADLYHRTKFVEAGERITETRTLVDELLYPEEDLTDKLTDSESAMMFMASEIEIEGVD